jgi:hypothetical protein
VHHLAFPMLTFLQWLKSTNRFQVIEYLSMLGRTLDDYQVMDKRLKLMSVNDKKSVILVVDHAELCEGIIAKTRSVKTVLIYRLKKAAEGEELGLISAETKKKKLLE